MTGFLDVGEQLHNLLDTMRRNVRHSDSDFFDLFLQSQNLKLLSGQLFALFVKAADEFQVSFQRSESKATSPND